MVCKQITAYYCEPFMISGLLPTLGPPILKRALCEIGIAGKIFYPALRFFIEDCAGGSPLLMKLADDIPLQITDYFFMDDIRAAVFLEKLPPEFHTHDIFHELADMRKKARKQVESLIRTVRQNSPDIFCFSVTFGSAFAQYLLPEIKRESPSTVIIVGGSCCTPEYALHLQRLTPEIDYVLCDETTASLVELVKALFFGTGAIPSCVGSAGHPAENMHTLSSLDNIPIPDFDDYFDLIDSYGIPRSQVTLPYEVSRGCWWCQQKPCNMCGFFGVRKKYIMKSPGIVVREIRYLTDTYTVNKFRFSDLVQPVEPMLSKLNPLSSLNLKLFWELRPDISINDLATLRRQGMTYAQIGLESLNTQALIHMNKGTDAIHNVSVLIQAQTLKIDLIWNYLYGLPGDRAEWYDPVIAMIPLLYHVQPPVPRRCWSNKYSAWYERDEDDDVIVRISKCDHALEEKYQELIDAVAEWQMCFGKGYRLCIDRSCSNRFRILRHYEQEELFDLTETDALLYRFFSVPHKMEDALSLGLSGEKIQGSIERFLSDKLMLEIDGYYLSLATDSSPYKWTKSRDQVLHYVLPN